MGSTPQALVLGTAVSLALGSGASADDGLDVDLTGTWQGTQVCEELIGGEASNFVFFDNPLLVVQDGNRFRFLVVGLSPDEVTDDLVYEGVVQQVEGGAHAEAMAGICGGDYEAQELVRLRRIETSEDGGRFDADSIFFTDDYPIAEGALDFATCKWAYERVSTDPPRVPSCERPGIRPTHQSND
jgi:hypothetical protein